MEASGTWGLSNSANMLFSEVFVGRMKREVGECGTRTSLWRRIYEEGTRFPGATASG